MFIKTTFLILALALFTFATPKDTVKGQWLGVFSIAGHTADVTLDLDVHGSKVTGTISSEHTGPGTIEDGKWENGKLTCTLKFEKHESIALSGWLKEGKLMGDFQTEGMSGTFTATKK